MKRAITLEIKNNKYNHPMGIDGIRRKYKSKGYDVDKREYSLTKVEPMHIFDADMSVNWNIQKSAEWNAEVERDRVRYAVDVKNKESELHSDVCNYLIDTYRLNNKQALMIESYAFSEKHSCMEDYFSFVDELGALMSKVIQCN